MINGQAVELNTRSGPRKFTPERLQQIINLVERGKNRDEIADILGVTIGSLQVTCSKIGISLRRPKINNGVYILRKRKLSENGHHPSDHNGPMPSEPTEGQSCGTSQLEPAGPAIIAEPQQERATASRACSACFAIRIEYRGGQRTHELPLTTHMIGELALEATVREVPIGELIAEIIKAMADKDLFKRVLGDIDPGS
jgi:hypothetical protein